MRRAAIVLALIGCVGCSNVSGGHTRRDGPYDGGAADQHVDPPSDGGVPHDLSDPKAKIVGQIQLQRSGFASAWFATQTTGTGGSGGGGATVSCEPFGACSACVVGASPSPDLAPPDAGTPDFAAYDLAAAALVPDLASPPPQLNAGTIFVSGTTPSFQLLVDSSGTYAVHSQTTPLWATTANIHVSANGAPPIPPFDVTLVPPDATPLTSAPSTVHRTTDYAMTWPATDGTLFVGLSTYRVSGGTSASVSCRFDRGLGKGTIPKAALAKLPSTLSGEHAAWVTFSSIASETVSTSKAEITVEAWVQLTAPTPSDGFSIE